MGSHEIWSWAALVVAFALALLVFEATESKYRDYASWTRQIGAALETAAIRRKGESALLEAVITVRSPTVAFANTVERVDFALERGGKRLGYFCTLPGEITVDRHAEGAAVAVTRISVRKDVSGQLAPIVDAPQAKRQSEAGVGSDSAVRFAGDVVVEVALRRGDRLLRVPVEGDVEVDSGA
jgi:hypothetical protein